QRAGHDDGARGVSTQWGRALGLRVDEFCVRRKYQNAVFSASERRPSLVVVCRDEEEQRAHGTYLREFVCLASNGPAVFHRVWAFWSPRHGVVLIHEEYLGRQADRCVQ